MNERSLFLSLLEIEDPAARLARLEQACAHEPAMRARLEKLLRAHEAASAFMDRPAAHLIGTDADDGVGPEGPGTVLGPYRLLEQIGEGGFGLVFRAEQRQPVRRQVAVKVLKPGMDTRQVVARFGAERQALALLSHPNIVHVFDGGETPSGRPYFVMELVDGDPVTDFCDRERLGVRRRLELFVEVCRAVQHAHQKGIIHRDLKPTNVLVALRGAAPVAKVIDFGIAKAVAGPLTDTTPLTQGAHLMGTPAYMSPEQAGSGPADVDTRTDVYSLGVLLYELLTGTTPFDRARLRTLSPDEVRRVIRDEDPPRPSARVRAVGAAAGAAAACRRTDPRRLGRLCRSELDWVVMKALDKDRNRRYTTVAALAEDVERYLRDEPVQACPPSAWTRLRKLARRHRAAAAAGAVLAAAALLGVAGLSVSYVLIRQEQDRTRQERDHADEAQRLAEARAEEIRLGLERLVAAQAQLDRGRWYLAQARLDDAHAAFSRAVELRPDLASAWGELADLHAVLGLWELAARDFARAYALGEPQDTLRWRQHALLRLHQNDRDGYRSAARRMAARFRGTHNHPFVVDLARACAVSPEADPEMVAALDRVQPLLHSLDRDWAFLYASGMVHHRAGQHREAVGQLRRSLALPSGTHRDMVQPVLALAHLRLGEAAEARAALAAAAGARERWLAEMYQGEPYGPRWVHHLGGTRPWPLLWWDWLEFELLYREACRCVGGADVPADPRERVLRARAEAALRFNAAADADYTEAVRLCPHDAMLRLEAFRSRGYARAAEGRWREAAEAFGLAASIRPEEVRLGHFAAVAQTAAGDRAAYRATCARLLERFTGTDDRLTACFVLRACTLAGDGPATVPDRLTRLVEGHGYFGAAVRGAALYRAGAFAAAIRCLQEAAVDYRPRAWDWCFLAMAHHRLGNGGEARRCLAEAARWMDEADREGSNDPASIRPAWGAWYEKPEFSLLLREARALIGPPAGP